MSQTIEITAISPDTLSRLLSTAYRRRITEEQVREIAEVFNLLADNETINLIHYTAALVRGEYAD